MAEPPLTIRAHQAEQTLELIWSPGDESRLGYRLIRAQCPCASCRDEWTGERLLNPESIRPDLALTGMETVGNYAVQFTWNDGHSSGIYTWEALREFAKPPS